MTNTNTNIISAPHRPHEVAPRYHVRLKHNGITLAILQGDTEAEVQARARVLAESLYPGASVKVEPA